MLLACCLCYDHIAFIPEQIAHLSATHMPICSLLNIRLLAVDLASVILPSSVAANVKKLGNNGVPPCFCHGIMQRKWVESSFTRQKLLNLKR